MTKLPFLNRFCQENPTIPKLLTLHVGVLLEFEGGFCTQYLNFHFMGRLNGGMHISQSEIYNLDEAIFFRIAKRNPKFWPMMGS